MRGEMNNSINELTANGSCTVHGMKKILLRYLAQIPERGELDTAFKKVYDSKEIHRHSHSKQRVDMDRIRDTLLSQKIRSGLVS